MIPILDTPPIPSGTIADPASHLGLRAFSYDDRRAILPAVNDVLTGSGCWLLHRQPQSFSMTEFRFELQMRTVLELYAGLLSAGVELTRGSHQALTGLCTLQRYDPHPRRLGHVITVKLELTFLEDDVLPHPTLPSGTA